MPASAEEQTRIACFATQGTGSLDEARITTLLAPLRPHLISFERSRRFRGALSLLRRIRALEPDLIVMEGTGVAGGGVVLLSRLLDGRPYVVSSGDAVAPFLAAISRALWLPGIVYERMLYRMSCGFIGWSPYLVGRALTMGAQRAMTAPNWSELVAPSDTAAARRAAGLPEDALVFGIVGSLNWNARYGYCYGLELVKAALRVDRNDLCVLVVGDGDGRERLQTLAGERLNRSIFLPGAATRAQLPDYLAAMDVASLPQSVDQVGSFRYTTKVSEYLSARLPIVTGQIPLAYDLDAGFLWRLPGEAPWDERYVTALAQLMSQLDRKEVAARRPAAVHAWLFDADRQINAVSEFVLDALERERRCANVRQTP